jgi:hypothetical protein
MGSSSYLSILYTVILLLRVWGRTVTRKNGKNSDNQQKLETILYKLKLTLSLLFLREESLNTLHL